MKMYVDEKTIAYVNHYAEQLDSNLYSQLKDIDEKYKKLGLSCSEQHLNERSHIIKQNWKITEIEAGVIETQRRQRLEEIVVNDRGRLILHQKEGRIVYWTASLKRYETILKPKTNPYCLLQYLIQNPIKVFPTKDLVGQLNPQRTEGYGTDDRRVRDTVEAIRKKLGLTKNPQDDIFIVDRGFGLKCDVELKS